MKKFLSFLLVLSMIISCLSMVTFVANAEEIGANANAFKIQGTGAAETYTVMNQADGLFSGVEFAESETTKALKFTLYNAGTTSLSFTIRIAEGWNQNLYVGETNYYNKGVTVSIAPGAHQEISVTIPKTYSLSKDGEATQTYTSLGLRFYWPRALTADDVIYVMPEDKTIIDNYANAYGVKPVKEAFEIPTPVALTFAGETSAKLDTIATGVFKDVAPIAEGETTKTVQFAVYSKNAINFQIIAVDEWTQVLFAEPGKADDGIIRYNVKKDLAAGQVQVFTLTVPATYYLPNAAADAGKSYTELDLRLKTTRALTADDIIYFAPLDTTMIDNWNRLYGTAPGTAVNIPFTMPTPTHTSTPTATPAPAGIKFEVTETSDGNYFYYFTASKLTKEMAVENKITKNFVIYNTSDTSVKVSTYYMNAGWGEVSGTRTTTTIPAGEKATVTVNVSCDANGTYDETNGVDTLQLRFDVYTKAEGDAVIVASENNTEVLDITFGQRSGGTAGKTSVAVVNSLPAGPTPTPAPVGVKFEVTETFDGGYPVFQLANCGLTKEMAVNGVITKKFVIHNVSETDTLKIYVWYQNGWTDLNPQVLDVNDISAGGKKTFTVAVPCDENGKTSGGIDVSALTLRFDIRTGLTLGNAIIIETENNPEVALITSGFKLTGGAGKVGVSTVNYLPGQATPTPEATHAPTAVPGPKYVGKKIASTTDVKGFVARSESNIISGLSDGNHSISYLVYNNGGIDIDIKMSLQNSDVLNEQDYGTLVTIPAFGAGYVSYDFVVESGLIKGSVSSSQQEDISAVFDIQVSAQATNGLGLIPAGTEIIFAYNKADGTDYLRTLDDDVVSTDASEILSIPTLSKKVTTHTAAENTFWYTSANAGIESFVNGTHTVKYTVYNPNNFAIAVSFYLQNGTTTVNGNVGTEKVIDAGTKEELSYTYTVTDGKYFDAVATDMTIRFDVKPAKNETSLPEDTSIYIEYASAPDKDPIKNLKSTQVVGVETSSTVVDMTFALDYKPTGIIYTAGKTISNPYFVTGSSGGLFTKDDIKDGKLVFEQYVFNESDYDVTFYTAYHTVTTSGGWDGLKSGELMTVEANSGAWIKASLAVNADDTITVGGEKYPIEDFFLRLYFSKIEAGTRLIITTDEQKLDNMLKPNSSAEFTAKLTYDKKYIAPNTTVDPTFHISSAFGSHMVLQRDRLVPVWGFSTYIGETVTVTFKGQEKTAVVTEDGKWTVTLDSMPADKNPAELTATCNGKTHTYVDILVGDVFLIGGQSNADMALSSCRTEYSTEYKEQLIASGEGNIRFFRQGQLDALVDRTKMDTPQKEPINGNVWTRENYGTANSFSATGFFFCHNLYDVIDVPIGMIMVASAGSPLSQLMSKEAADATGYDRYENSIPVSGMYNALMNPFVEMSFKAMIFDQGGSEHSLAITNYGKYIEYLNAYVEDLREKNGYDFPFYYAQLTLNPVLVQEGRGEQRAVQFDGLKVVKNSGLIVAMDQSARPGDPDPSHPMYKEPIGERFARLVLAKAYGVVDEEYNISPMAEYATKTENGVVITYKYVGDGLKKLGQHETLSGFRAMTGIRTYVPVEATIISENQVLLDTTGIDGIIGVAYAIEMNNGYIDFSDASWIANLGNSEGLPAAAFKMPFEDKIVGAQTNIGKDLTLNMHSTVQGQMKIYHDGEEIVIDGAYNEASGSYVYMYEGINPQCMGDKIDMQLWVGGEIIDSKEDYSIATYCNNIYNTYKADGAISEKEEGLLNLLADMLDFGAESQKYKNYKTETLMNGYSWINEYKTAFVKPESVRNVTATTNSAYKFSSVGLHIDNYISIYVKLNVVSWDNVSVKVNFNGGEKTYTKADFSGTILYLDDLTSTQYGLVHTIELVVDGITVQTLTYSANSYIATMYNGANSDIVQAIGRYGASAVALTNAQ